MVDRVDINAIAFEKLISFIVKVSA